MIRNGATGLDLMIAAATGSESCPYCKEAIRSLDGVTLVRLFEDVRLLVHNECLQKAEAEGQAYRRRLDEAHRQRQKRLRQAALQRRSERLRPDPRQLSLRGVR